MTDMRMHARIVCEHAPSILNQLPQGVCERHAGSRAGEPSRELKFSFGWTFDGGGGGYARMHFQ